MSDKPIHTPPPQTPVATPPPSPPKSFWDPNDPWQFQFDDGCRADVPLLPCGKPAPRPEKTVFCDIRQLILEVNFTEGGSQKLVKKDTVQAATAGKARSLRPRDLSAPTMAPSRIQSLLSTYDLVIETLAPEAGRGLGSVKAQKAPSGFDKAGQASVRDQLPNTVAAPSAVISAKAQWKVQCGLPEHHNLLLEWDPKHQSRREESGPGRLEATEIVHDVVCKPALESACDILGLLKSFADPRKMANEYKITGRSHGRPSTGPETTSLKALVVAYPAGAIGVRASIGPLGWSIGWGGHEGWHKDGGIPNAQQARSDAQAGYEMRRSELQTVAGGKGAGARPKQKGSSRAARRRFEHERTDANRARADARAELKKLKEPPKSVFSAQYWSGDEFSDLFDVSFIVLDRELSLEELGDEGRQITQFLSCIRTIMSGAENFREKFMLAMSFMNDYAPSAVRPSAEISLEIALVEIFFGTKMSTDDITTGVRYELNGDRYRALTRYLDLEAAFVPFDVSGSLGITFGRKLLGTGATLEALITLGCRASGDYEWKSRLGLEDERAGSEEAEVRIQADLTASGAVLVQATFLYFDLAVVEISANGGAVFRLGCAPDQILDPKQWQRTMLRKPLVGGADYRFIGGLKRRKSYTIWEGGDITL